MAEFFLLMWAVFSMCLVKGNTLLWLVGMAAASMWYLLAVNFSISMRWRDKHGRW